MAHRVLECGHLQFEQSAQTMMSEQTCEGLNGAFWNETGITISSVKPRPGPDWIAIQHSSPCEVPPWAGGSGGDFSKITAGYRQDMSKETIWHQEE